MYDTHAIVSLPDGEGDRSGWNVIQSSRERRERREAITSRIKRREIRKAIASLSVER